MDLIMAALGGAIGGGLGVLVGVGAGRLAPESWRRNIEVGFVVLLGALGARFAPMVAGPQQQDPANIERELLADDTFGSMAAAWRESDPASFNAFLARTSAGMNGSNRAAAIEQGRAELRSVALPRLRNLSDADLVELIRLSRDQMRELQTSHPVACHPLFHGRRFGDITPYLSEGVRAREIALLTAAFRADPNAPHPALEGDALNAAINALVQSTRTQFGEEIALIAPDANIEGHEPRVCEAAAALYDEMQKLPRGQAAGLMRGLMAISAQP